MKKLIFVTLVLITTLSVSGCEQKTEKRPVPVSKKEVTTEGLPKEDIGKPTTARPPVEHETARLLYVREKGVEDKYKGLSNPLEATEDNIKKGKELYRTRCSMCHGEKGLGDVPAGRALSPPASNIAVVAGISEVTDAYLFWTISEGGVNLKTLMPSFKDKLSEEDRWRVILYVRTELDGEKK
jgi:mono/diheme cytochrome c family protein